jgi:hypothetical protein
LLQILKSSARVKLARNDIEALERVPIRLNHSSSVMPALVAGIHVAESAQNISFNYGLMDIIAALRWVKNNIGNFGSDPSNLRP